MRLSGMTAAILFVATATAVFAQAEQREAVMKEVGGGFGVINKMNRGQAPFDAAAATAAFEKIAAAGAGFAPLFDGAPSPTKTSLPAIWENKADFDTRLAKLQADATAGAAEAAKGEAEFKTAFSALAQNCSGCHEKYRGD